MTTTFSIFPSNVVSKFNCPSMIKTISYLIWIKTVPTIFWPFFSTHPKLLIKSVSRQTIWTGQLSHSLIPNERVLYNSKCHSIQLQFAAIASKVYMYIPSTIYTDYVLWHLQCIVAFSLFSLKKYTKAKIDTLPKDSSRTRFIWVFIVLGIY